MQCEFKKPPYFLCNQKMLFSSLVELERQLSTTSTARTLIFACQLLPLLKKNDKNYTFEVAKCCHRREGKIIMSHHAVIYFTFIIGETRFKSISIPYISFSIC